MWFIGNRALKLARKRGKLQLEYAQKVLNYRLEEIPEGVVERIKGMMGELREVMEGEDVKGIEGKIGELDVVLREHGGYIYPVRVIPDNVEMFLVAIVVALVVRTFFLQPFTIPTNSMWPTYHGMVGEVYTDGKVRGGKMEGIRRMLLLGATKYEVKAPESGEIWVPLFSGKEGTGMMGRPKFEIRKGFSGFLIPMDQKRYGVRVGGSMVRFEVPLDFQVETVMLKYWFNGSENYGEVLKEAMRDGRVKWEGETLYWKTGRYVNAGERVLDFDILAGDKLFADRLTYHFRRPQVGEPIVFKTDHIEAKRKANGEAEEKYFIKRLVGMSGDVLSIEEPVLYRNGKVIEGAKAFKLNHDKVGLYRGYQNYGLLREGAHEEVKEGYVFGMGDNSWYSEDSRYWGQIPERDVIGKAFFIFYPFTERWGFSR